MNILRFSFILLCTALVFSPATASACATCFGQSDEAMAKGMNMGILALLVCIVGVLVGMVGVGIFLARRAGRLAALSNGNDRADFAMPVGQNLK